MKFELTILYFFALFSESLSFNGLEIDSLRKQHFKPKLLPIAQHRTIHYATKIGEAYKIDEINGSLNKIFETKQWLAKAVLISIILLQGMLCYAYIF